MRRDWLDLRALALAASLALAAALPSITRSVERRDYYFFDVTLTSTSPGATQLFWDLGRGYNESDSSRQPLKVEPQPVVYRYMMPMGDIKALRLDPIDGRGTLTLAHARIVDYRGRVRREFGPRDFTATNHIARLETHGETLTLATTGDATDPTLELALRTPLHLPGDNSIWLRHGLPVAVPVFLLGLLLGSPFVARPLATRAGRLAHWLRARPGRAIMGMAALAVVAQCHPVLFQGRSFATPLNGGLMLYGRLPTLPGSTAATWSNTMGSDIGAFLFQHVYYPMAQRDALAQGEIPLWNRYSLCGEPLLGQGQTMFGDPFNCLTILTNGASWAWDIRFILARWIFAAALGGVVWRLTRHLGAALLTTAASAFIGFTTFRLVHPANFSVGYAPAILWAWLGLIQASTPRRQAWWLLGLVTANWLVLTSGTMKEAAMLIAGLNLTGLLWLALLPEAQGRRVRLLGLATAAGSGFLLLSAPGWLSFLVAWKHSYTYYDTPQAVPLPLTQILGFFDDIFYRQQATDEVVVAPALNFVFLLGALWWLVRPSRWLKDRGGLALLLAALPPWALAFGLVPPALIVKLPFIGNIVHVGNTFSCVLLVLVAVLAGYGFRDAFDSTDARSDGGVPTRVLLALGALAAMFFLSTHGLKKSPFFSGYAAALLLTAGILPGTVQAALRASRPGVLSVVVALGLPILLWRHCQFGETEFNAYAFSPGQRADLHAPSPGAALVDQQLASPGRVVGWGNSVFPSYNTALGWESLYGVDALRSRHYQELAIELGLQRVWAWDWYNNPADAPRLVRAHDALNVTHYVADPSDPPTEIPGLHLLGQLDLAVYASQASWPRAFFTDRLITYPVARDFAQQIYDGDGRPFAACQTGESGAPALPTDLATRTVQAATDYRLTSNNTTFVVNASGPGVAVLNETYYAEDFQVTVNGRPAPYFRVNHAFKGVAIPAAGRHEITFAYWPRHFTLALWLGAAGLGLLAAGFFWLRSRPELAA